jgi:RNA polymerase sigma factor (sigma-70 family)
MENIKLINGQTWPDATGENHQHAFTSLFNCHRLQLYNTAFKIAKSKAIAEDVVHDVFLKWWLQRAELTVIKHPAAYLHAMTRNLTVDNLRKGRHENIAKKNMVSSLFHDGGIEDRFTERQYQVLISKAVLSMPPKQQEVYRLVKEKGLCHEKTAHELHISCTTVKKHMANALKFIRCCLQKNGVVLK